MSAPLLPDAVPRRAEPGLPSFKSAGAARLNGADDTVSACGCEVDTHLSGREVEARFLRVLSLRPCSRDDKRARGRSNSAKRMRASRPCSPGAAVGRAARGSNHFPVRPKTPSVVPRTEPVRAALQP